MTKLSVGFRVEAATPAHIRVVVFVGPEAGRGYAGALNLRVEEFWWLLDVVNAGLDRAELPPVVLSGIEVER